MDDESTRRIAAFTLEAVANTLREEAVSVDVIKDFLRQKPTLEEQASQDRPTGMWEQLIRDKTASQPATEEEQLTATASTTTASPSDAAEEYTTAETYLLSPSDLLSILSGLAAHCSECAGAADALWAHGLTPAQAAGLTT